MIKAIAHTIQQGVSSHPQATISSLIFVICCAVYLANGSPISANDNVPNALLALNWFDNSVLNFDAFRTEAYYRSIGTSSLPYYFVEAPNGHVSSTYPIGVAIVTFPVYAILFAGVRIAEVFQSLITESPVNLLEITSPQSIVSPFFLEKIAATIVASLSVVIFYLIVRLKFSPAVCVFAVFAYAFATATWQTNSQGLWQHASSNLAVLSLVLCLLKANRVEGNRRRLLLLVAGIFCGLLPGIRPTSSVYAVAATLYALLVYRKEALFLLLGLPSLLISASWNFYNFGFSLRNFVYGGYTRMSENRDFAQTYYAFTLEQFIKSSTGYLFSPSRGLLVFSPVVLFAAPGGYHLWKRRLDKDEQLLLAMSTAGLLLFIQYSFFKIWGAGWSYGPRYMTDLLPILCLLIAYFLANFFQQIGRIRPLVFRGIFALFLTLLLYSTFVQVVGVFGWNYWNSIPNPSNSNKYWSLQDSQIERHARRLWFNLTKPIPNPTDYMQQFAGTVLSIEQVNEQPAAILLRLRTGGKANRLVVQVKNTGQNQWYGYQTGADIGVASVRVQLFQVGDRTRPVSPPAYLYVSGNPKPGETARAIGNLPVQVKAGEYDLVLDAGVMHFGLPPRPDQHPPFVQKVIVQ
jgi:hypothetical protein